MVVTWFPLVGVHQFPLKPLEKGTLSRQQQLTRWTSGLDDVIFLYFSIRNPNTVFFKILKETLTIYPEIILLTLQIISLDSGLATSLFYSLSQPPLSLQPLLWPPPPLI